MSESPVIARVTALVAPILRDLDLHLYDIDFGAGLLKVTVDRQGGVTLDDLALVTRLVNRELDHEDPVPGKYTLEVSSPGVERSLRRPEHFASVVGRAISVRLRDVTNEARRFEGTLLAADADGEGGITVRLDDAAGTERQVPYHHIDRAKTVFVWSPTPKGERRNTKAHPAQPASTEPQPRQGASAS